MILPEFSFIVFPEGGYKATPKGEAVVGRLSDYALSVHVMSADEAVAWEAADEIVRRNWEAEARPSGAGLKPWAVKALVRVDQMLAA